MALRGRRRDHRLDAWLRRLRLPLDRLLLLRRARLRQELHEYVVERRWRSAIGMWPVSLITTLRVPDQALELVGVAHRMIASFSPQTIRVGTFTSGKRSRKS